MAAFDLVQCLACGLHTNFSGEKAVPASDVNEGVTVADIEAPPSAVEVSVAEPKSAKGKAAASAKATGEGA
jgi:hypothetical protein